MEVVSPSITFDQTNVASTNKRRIADGVENNEEDVNMMQMDESCGFQAAKRRRKNDHPSFDNNSSGGGWMSPFAVAAGGTNGGGLGKRSRSRSPQTHSPAPPSSIILNTKIIELQNTLSRQSHELSTLKSQHAAVLSSHADLSNANVQLTNENKILKRAVTIQQDRQTQLSNEINEYKRWNEEAKDTIRRLEQMNGTLRYQLQALGNRTNDRDDFMGGFHRPPDVY